MHELTRETDPAIAGRAARGSIALAALLTATALALAPARSAAKDAHAHHAQQAAPSAAGKGTTRAEVRYQVPDAQLIDSHGAKVSLRSELGSGKPVLLNFIFTSCTAICPVMSATMSEVQNALGAQRDRVRIVSISIDPEYDTPARLKEYAARHRAGPQWHMLTGNKQTILEVARAFDAWRGDKMNHTVSTYLNDGAGGAWVRIDGFATPKELVHEVHRMLGAPLPAEGG